MPATLEVITSRSNPRVKLLRAALADTSRSRDLIALEGEHLVQEALRSGLPLQTVFLSTTTLAPPWLPRSVEILRIDAAVFDSISATQASQGIAATITPPTWTLADMLPAAPLLLVAAGLQDPGNLGTLLRSAEAFGATGVLTSANTVSPWNQKAIRSSAGSVLRIPHAPATPQQLRAVPGLRILATSGDLTLQPADIASVDLTAPTAILIGNEGAGLPHDWLNIADALVTIPCPGPVESLNAGVAASILLYEAFRQRSRATTPRSPAS